MIFNATEHKAEMGFPLLPSGDYLMALVAHEVKPTKDGAGKYLKATLEILDGEAKGRKIWHNFTRENKSAEAVRIGNQQLACLCVATGKAQVNTWEELYGIPIVVTLGAKRNSQSNELENVVKNFKSRDAARATATASKPATPSASPVPAGKPKVAPWKSKAKEAAAAQAATPEAPPADPAPTPSEPPAAS